MKPLINRELLAEIVQNLNIEGQLNPRKRNELQIELTRKYNEQEDPLGNTNTKGLQKAWANLKSQAKGKKTEFLQAQKRTGGGPPPGKADYKLLITQGPLE